MILQVLRRNLVMHTLVTSLVSLAFVNWKENYFERTQLDFFSFVHHSYRKKKIHDHHTLPSDLAQRSDYPYDIYRVLEFVSLTSERKCESRIGDKSSKLHLLIFLL
jgi:hypothetical protein